MEVIWERVNHVDEYMNLCFLHFPMHITVYTVKEKQIGRTEANYIHPGESG